MKKLLALGADQTGPTVAGKLARRLEEHRWVPLIDLDTSSTTRRATSSFQFGESTGTRWCVKPAPFPP